MNEPRFGTAGLADSYTVKKFDPAAIAAYTAGFGLYYPRSSYHFV